MPMLRSLVRYWPAQRHTWEYICRCSWRTNPSSRIPSTVLAARARAAQRRPAAMLACSTRFRSALVATNVGIRPAVSSAVNGVAPTMALEAQGLDGEQTAMLLADRVAELVNARGLWRTCSSRGTRGTNA